MGERGWPQVAAMSSLLLVHLLLPGRLLLALFGLDPCLDALATGLLTLCIGSASLDQHGGFDVRPPVFPGGVVQGLVQFLAAQRTVGRADIEDFERKFAAERCRSLRQCECHHDHAAMLGRGERVGQTSLVGRWRIVDGYVGEGRIAIPPMQCDESC